MRGKKVKPQASESQQPDLFAQDGLDALVVAGVDEAGRGPLCGNVVAAAVILDPERPIEGLRDSKKLSEAKREALAPEIRERAAAWGIGEATPAEIDELNILQATMLAMQRAVAMLCKTKRPDLVLVDGNRTPKLDIPAQSVVKGDDLVQAISAASILAKTKRDAELRKLDALYPEYGFAKHKGYGTKAHLEALEARGLIEGVYRKSFAPVARIAEAGKKAREENPSGK